MKTILVYSAHDHQNLQVLNLQEAQPKQVKLAQLQNVINTIGENVVVAFGPQPHNLATVKALLELGDMKMLKSSKLKNCITDQVGMFFGEFGEQELVEEPTIANAVSNTDVALFEMAVEAKIITRNGANWYELGETVLERNIQDSIVELKEKELWQQLLSLLEQEVENEN